MGPQLARQPGAPELTLAEANRAGLRYSTYIQNPRDPSVAPGWRYGATLEEARDLSLEETDPTLRMIHNAQGTIIERRVEAQWDGVALGASGTYQGKLGKLNESVWGIVPLGLLTGVAASAVSLFPALAGQETDAIAALGRTLAIFFGGGFLLPILASKTLDSLGFRGLNRRIFRIFEEITGERATAVKFKRNRLTHTWTLESLSGNYELTYTNLAYPKLLWRRTVSRPTQEISPVDIREITA